MGSLVEGKELALLGICGRLLLLQEYGKRPDLILSSPASQLFVSVSVL